MHNASRDLRHRYNTERFAAEEDEWPPYKPKHYTTLALIHYQGRYADTKVISLTRQLAAEGNLVSSMSQMDSKSRVDQTNMFSNTTKNIADLFLPKQNSDGSIFIPNTVLIEGAPGIGKTVLSKEIAFQWANNKLLQSKTLLFLIFLRNVCFENINSIEMFFQDVLHSSQMASSVAEYVTDNGGEDLTIVLDGYDELSEDNRKNSFITAIIHRQLLPKCLVVITSRPTASMHLRDYVDCRVEVVGFSEADRLDYIKTALPESYEQVNIYLQSNPTINALCYIPLNMTILLCLVENGIDNLPKTQTKLYENFIEMTIIHFLRKTIENFSTLTIKSLFELPDPHNKVFRELAKFAFEALRCDKLVFTLDELNKICPHLVVAQQNWNGLGLLNSVKGFVGKDYVTYHFLHFSVQEYMAAYHISTLPTDKQTKLLTKEFWTVSYYNTWIMYAGITGGTSLAFEHFLSGNWFRISTKIFGFKSISSRLLNDKVKRLHMFQCLTESQNNKVISLLKDVFQDQVIDLSCQTLLPRDLNTLGFFLIRSSNKQWRKLNLSNCNIGSDRCKILSDSLLSNNDYNAVSTDCIDLSYNQLNFSSFVGLFDMFKSLHVVEIIVADNTILNNNKSCDLFSILEKTFISSGNATTLLTVSIGYFFFAYKIDERHILPIKLATQYMSVYLLNCNEANLPIEVLHEHDLLDVHLLATPIESLKDMLLNNSNIASLFVYDSTLSDKAAEEIGDLILSKESAGIMLVVSEHKLQGIINTSTVCSELSKLELLNVIVTLRSLCSNNKASVVPWSNELCLFGDQNKAMIHSFLDALLIISTFRIKVKLFEGSVLFAHNIKFKDIDNDVPFDLTTNVYLSCCNFSDSEYRTIITNRGEWSISVLYIVHSSFSLNTLCSILSDEECAIQELFLHTDCSSSVECLNASVLKAPKISVVFVGSSTLVVHNPTSKQLALAVQLEPSVNVWKFLACQLNADLFLTISFILVVTNKMWVELEFPDCDIRHLHCDIVHEHFTIFNSISRVTKLNLSSCNLPLSASFAFVDILVLLNVKELIICEETFYISLVQKLREKMFRYTGENQIALTVLHTEIKTCFFHTVQWNTISKSIDKSVDKLFMFNCQLPQNEVFAIMHALPNLSQLCFVHCSLQDIVVSKVFTEFARKEMEVSIIDTGSLSYVNLYGLLTDNSLLFEATIHFVVMMSDILYGYNVSRQQFSILGTISNNFSEIEHKITLLAGVKMHKSLFAFHDHQLKALHFIGREDEIIDITPIVSAINTMGVSLTTFGLKNTSITKKGVYILKNILKNNCSIEELYLNNTLHYTVDALKIILEVLKNMSSLKSLEISHIHINDEIVNDLVTVLSHNSKLNNLAMRFTNLQDAGILKLSGALLNGSGLRRLALEHNRITEKGSDNIVKVLLHHTNLQVVNLNGNNLRAGGIIKIASALNATNHLQTLQLDNNNATEEAADSIADVLLVNANINKLYLNGNDFQAAGVIKIANGLQNIHGLQLLGLGNNNATVESSDTIATVLSHNSTIQVLDLGGNDLQAKGVFKIVEGLYNTYTLQQLLLNNNKITEEAADYIAIVLLLNTELKVLNLNDNDLRSAGVIKVAKALQHNSSLIELHISNNKITEYASEDIANAISCNTNLQVLNFDGNHFGTAGVLQLVKSMQNNCSLQQIGLGNNNITEEAAGGIALVLSHNANIRALNLGGNNLLAASIVKLAKDLKNISSLTKLDVSNSDILEEAAGDIADVLMRNPYLQVLNLNDNYLGMRIRTIAKGMQNISTLRQLELRNNNIVKEAASDLAAVLAYNDKLQILNLNGNMLEDAGISKIVKSLQCNSMLIELHLSDNNITQEAADDIATVLSYNSDLEVLNLNRNNLKAAGVTKVAKALRTTVLRQLEMERNKATKEAADDIAAVLAHSTNLQVLNLNGNMLETAGSKIANSLQSVLTLTKLHLSDNNITDEAADDIATILSHSNNLEVLTLNTNNFKISGVIKIINALQMSTLKQFEMERNQATKESADNIATVLSHNTNLQVLNLNGNMLESAGISIITNSLKAVSALTELYLSDNNITEKAADDIVTVLSHSNKLKVLNLNRNDLKATGIIKIAKALQMCTLQQLEIEGNNATKKAANDIAAVISRNTNLQVLNLNDNNLQAQGIQLIATALQSTSSLTHLYVSNNNITKEAASSVAQALLSIPNLQLLHLNGNNLGTMGVIKIAESLQNISTLKKLQLNNNGVTDVAAGSIAELLSHNNCIQELALGDNCFQCKGIMKIAKALKIVTGLTCLKINNCNITDRAAEDIANALLHNTSLQVLDLSGNNLGEGIIEITKNMRHINTLQQLSLCRNNISEAVAGDIADILTNNTDLQVLDLNDNNLDRGIIKILNGMQNISMLQQLGLSNNNITKEVASNLATVLSHNNQLQILNLNGNILETAGISKIVNSLQSNLTLTELHFSDNNITENAADDIAAVLSHSSNLKVLNLNRNHLKATGVIAIIKALQMLTLRQLEMENNIATKEAADDLAAVLSHNTNLRVLNLNRNMLQSAGISIIANSLQSIVTLTELYLSDNNITEKAADDIVTVLSHNNKLKVLSLNRNDLKATGVVKIAKALQMSTLKRLEIEGNNATKEAANDIAAVISRNTNLQVLNLNDNNLQAQGIQLIATALQSTSSLTHLYVSNNNITEEAASSVARALLNHPNLQLLYLNGNNLGTIGVIKIAESLQNISTLKKLQLNNNGVTDVAAGSIAEVLSHNKCIQELALGDNCFQFRGIMKIAKALKTVTCLTCLKVNNCNITDRAAEDIAYILAQNSDLQILDLNGNNLQTNSFSNIAKSLQNNSSLQELHLADNSATKTGAIYVAAIVSHSTNLQVLNLNGNNLQIEGTRVVLNNLKSISSLTKLYLSNNNITEDAADDIAVVLSHNSNLQVLDLSTNNFNSMGIIKITKPLQSMTSITELHISDINITDEGANYISTVLSYNTYLTVLNLNGSFQSAGIALLANGLQNTYTLLQLELANNKITKEAADDIAAIVDKSRNLQVLNLNANVLENVGIIKIANSLQSIITLTELYLSDNNITEKAADDIVTVLSHNNKLKVLNLNRNDLKATGVVKIAKALQMSTLKRLEIERNNATKEAANDIAVVISRNTNLQVLNLNDNNLQAQGIQLIATALQSTSSLTHLYVSNNNITKEAASSVAQALFSNPKLQLLHLNGNNLGTIGVTKVAESLQNVSTLKKLQLNNNGVTDVAAGSIAELFSHNNCIQELALGDNCFQFRGIMKIAKALETVSGLTCLKVNNCNITDQAAEGIAYVLAQNTDLQVLDLNGNKLRTNGFGNIATGLQNNSSLQELHLADNNATKTGAIYVAAIVSHSTNLQVLNLNGNNLQTEGTRVVLNNLRSISSLTKLYLSDNNITEDAADDIAVVLSHNNNLQVLDLSTNSLNSMGIMKITKPLQNMASIAELHIGDNNITTDEGCNYISTILSYNTYLTVLNLNGSTFQSAGIALLANGLQNTYTLLQLELANNKITKEAADDIAAIVDKSRKLQVLNLNANVLENVGIIKIANSLQSVVTLTELYLSDNNITEKAVDDIVTVLSHNNKLKVLNLNRNYLKATGVVKIAKALQMSTLKRLEIERNNATKEAANDIAAVISRNTNLQVLNLNDNNLQTQGIQLIATALQSTSSLTHLYVSNNNITEEAASSVARALLNHPNLQLLYLNGNNLGTIGVIKIAESLQNISTLKKLQLNNNGVTDVAAGSIAEVLSHNNCIQELALGDNCFQFRGIMKIAKALKTVTCLTCLKVNNCNITDRAAEDIAYVLAQNSDLQILDLNGNNLQTNSFSNIATGLQNNSSLQELHLADNSATKTGAIYVAAIVSHSTNLQVLNLNGNNLQTEGTRVVLNNLKTISSLTKLYLNDNNITEDAADDIAVVLSHNSNLQVLDLDGNNLKTTGIIKVVRSLLGISTLQHLHLSSNNITEEAADDIAAVLSLTTNLQVVGLGGNNLQTAGTIKLLGGMDNTHTLQQLGLSNNNIINCKEAVDAFKTFLSHSTDLQVLDLDGNNLQIKDIIQQ